jgi:hypothetical protein
VPCNVSRLRDVQDSCLRALRESPRGRTEAFHKLATELQRRSFYLLEVVQNHVKTAGQLRYLVDDVGYGLLADHVMALKQWIEGVPERGVKVLQ